MRYVMRQRLFSFGDDFHIRDEQGRDVFYVDGKVFALRQTLVLRDLRGVDQVVIRRRLLAWGPTYEIERQGRLAAVVKKHLFTLFRARFTVDVPGPDDLEASGDLLDHEYAFARHGQTVATVSKRWFRLSDTYGVDIAPGEDNALILAATVVIDMCCHEGQD